MKDDVWKQMQERKRNLEVLRNKLSKHCSECKTPTSKRPINKDGICSECVSKAAERKRANAQREAELDHSGWGEFS